MRRHEAGRLGKLLLVPEPGDDGGAYNQADAAGFIKLNALRMRIAGAKAQARGAAGKPAKAAKAEAPAKAGKAAQVEAPAGAAKAKKAAPPKQAAAKKPAKKPAA